MSETTVSAKEKDRIYYGSVEGMPENVLRNRLREAQATVEELSKESERRSKFSSAQRLAERLHRLLHGGTVDCDFYYSNWPHATGCRADFERLAQNIEKWFANYAERSPAIVPDYPLGQMIAFMEAARFGENYVYRGGEDLK